MSFEPFTVKGEGVSYTYRPKRDKSGATVYDRLREQSGKIDRNRRGRLITQLVRRGMDPGRAAMVVDLADVRQYDSDAQAEEKIDAVLDRDEFHPDKERLLRMAYLRRSFADTLVDRGYLGRESAEKVVERSGIDPDFSLDDNWARIIESAKVNHTPLPESVRGEHVGTPPPTSPNAAAGEERTLPQAALAAFNTSGVGQAVTAARPALEAFQDWVANRPTPGGVSGLATALVFLLFVLVPATNGFTRLHLVWLTMTGRAYLVGPDGKENLRPTSKAPVIPLSQVVTLTEEAALAIIEDISPAPVRSVEQSAVRVAEDAANSIGKALGWAEDLLGNLP